MRPSGLVPLLLPFVLAGLGISMYVAYHQPATTSSHSGSGEIGYLLNDTRREQKPLQLLDFHSHLKYARFPKPF